ncbi:MAG: sigma-54-dependent Fis family transcriptional regulator [Desulfobacterium sp.]|nr:sigma-54-dependent Fis family transcriptional regulator [Desulfobacterium sp.]
MKTSILVVDDEPTFLNSVIRQLRLQGYHDLTSISNSDEVQSVIREKKFDVAFLDITMPKPDGIELLEMIKEKSPQTECIMLTANDNIQSVIQSIKLGAYDYLVKPITPDQLIHSLDRVLERKRMFGVLNLRHQNAVNITFNNPKAFQELITCDDKMLQILYEAELHAQSNITVLITGETGVGKELMARAIHQASHRAATPFVAINMLSLSSSLFESEFFGHIKGAFTDANQNKIGYLQQAEGGTVFLDEIGDLPIELQGKLLRVLQEKEYSRVGSTEIEQANVRFIAATNRDLEKYVKEGKFRNDLFYRLQFASIEIPPLRERRDDIRLLAANFLKKSERSDVILSEKAESVLVGHDWPGNVRELKGVVEAAVNLAVTGKIQPEQLKLPVKNKIHIPRRQKFLFEDMEPLSEVERKYILGIYDCMDQNKTHTARILGISLTTLQRKLRGYNVK